MKTLFISLCLLPLSLFVHAQNHEKAVKLIEEGIDLYEEQDYAGAIAKYNEALELENDNGDAYYERAMAYSAQEKFDRGIADYKMAIAYLTDETMRARAWAGWAACLDYEQKEEEALAVLDSAKVRFPNEYIIPFTRAVILQEMVRLKESRESLMETVKLNPDHATSHSILARNAAENKELAITIMVLARFFVAEPEGQRAAQNMEFMRNALQYGYTLTSKKKVNISLDASRMPDTTGKVIENDFRMQDFLFILTAATVMEKEFAKKSEAEKFALRFSTLCKSLEEARPKSFGFYWNQYADYFIALNNEGYTDVLGILVFASSGEKYISNWVEQNKSRLREFFEWSENWETNR